MTITIDFLMKRGTAAKWTSANPVLKAGQFGYEKDTGYLKVGDGTTIWNSLSYINAGLYYGACTTAAATAAKTVSVANFKLITGARVSVRFSNTNTASAPTLNVNSTGAKDVYFRGAKITNAAPTFQANMIYDFIYTGTYYELVGNIAAGYGF